ncbi:hypothetical protein C8J57DRAFT_1522275 [Mycena rebaudengoi]|nr:hypothetical protein C8J57DRAFT_1522275 [Mycena rebaudengoi]
MVEIMIYSATAPSEERAIRDERALIWTVKSLADDVELAPLVESIPDCLNATHTVQGFPRQFLSTVNTIQYATFNVTETSLWLMVENMTPCFGDYLASWPPDVMMFTRSLLTETLSVDLDSSTFSASLSGTLGWLNDTHARKILEDSFTNYAAQLAAEDPECTYLLVSLLVKMEKIAKNLASEILLG